MLSPSNPPPGIRPPPTGKTETWDEDLKTEDQSPLPVSPKEHDVDMLPPCSGLNCTFLRTETVAATQGVLSSASCS